MVLTMRVLPDLYEELRQNAEAQGRSIAAQAERRLMYQEPKANEVGRLVGLVVEAVERRAGKSWAEDASVRKRCRSAADFALTVLLGPEADIDKKWTGQKIADEVLGKVLVNDASDEELFKEIIKEKP